MLLPLPLLINLVEKSISQENIITFGSIGLIFYIAALILSKAIKFIIVLRWWNIIILAIHGIIFLGSFYMANNCESENVKFVNNIALNMLLTFSFTATIVLSIIANIIRGWIFCFGNTIG